MTNGLPGPPPGKTHAAVALAALVSSMALTLAVRLRLRRACFDFPAPTAWPQPDARHPVYDAPLLGEPQQAPKRCQFAVDRGGRNLLAALLVKPKLLILDDIGYLSLDQFGATRGTPAGTCSLVRMAVVPLSWGGACEVASSAKNREMLPFRFGSHIGMMLVSWQSCGF